MGLMCKKNAPEGVDFEGIIWRYEYPERLGTTWQAGDWNVNAVHRYSKKGIGATYGGATKVTARKEVEHWVGDTGERVATRKTVRLKNLLDLQDKSVRDQLGVSLDDITGDSYKHTHRIGDWAAQNGYNGIIAPSARFAGRANLVIFGGL